MIRLIAADMDGTLLNSRKELPSDFFPVIRALSKKGIRFVAASGRQYHNLLNLFEEIRDDTVFMSENGAMVFYRGKNISFSEISPDLVSPLLRAARPLDRVYAVIAGIHSAYIFSQTPEFLENVRMYCHKIEVVSDLREIVEKDKICKVAFYDAFGAETNSGPALKSFESDFQMALAGNNWLDLMNPGVNKGFGMKRIQELWNIAPEECMAFGDYLNDYEMMQICHYSYAMANAHPELKKVSRFETASNDDNGVMRVIETLL